MAMTDDDWTKCGVPVVERVKGEILADVRAGRVPATVASFAELHDHVDANEYGGACEADEDGNLPDPSSDEQTAFWNRVQNEVDAWIKAGGVKESVGQ